MRIKVPIRVNVIFFQTGLNKNHKNLFKNDETTQKRLTTIL